MSTTADGNSLVRESEGATDLRTFIEQFEIDGVFRPVQDANDDVVSIIVSGRDIDAPSDRGY